MDVSSGASANAGEGEKVQQHAKDVDLPLRLFEAGRVVDVEELQRVDSVEEVLAAPAEPRDEHHGLDREC